MNSHPTAQTYPYTIRLFVDVDPAGNPVGTGCVLFEGGKETSTIWFTPPGPFDSLADAWTDLVCDYVDELGTQPTLL